MTLKEYQAQLIAALTPESLAVLRSHACGPDGAPDPDKDKMMAMIVSVMNMCHFAELDIDELVRDAISKAREINESVAEGEQ